MKEKTIKVLKVAPKMPPEIVTLDNNLRALQEAVSIGADYVGLIEIIDLDDKTCILCNEEGKLIQLEPNRRFYDDVLCGVFYLTGQDKQGNLTSLSDAQIKHYAEVYAIPEKFLPMKQTMLFVEAFLLFEVSHDLQSWNI